MRDRDQELRTNLESVGISGWGFNMSQQKNIFDATDGSQNCYEPPTLLLGELAQKPPAQQLAQDTLGEVAYAIAISILAPTIHLLLTPRVCGLSSWRNYDTAIIIHVPFLFFRRLVVSCSTCGAGVRPWSSISRSCGGALEKTPQYDDLDFSDGGFKQSKPPARKKSIHVWECCQCGLGNIKINLESCPDCGVPRCVNCQTTKIQVR